MNLILDYSIYIQCVHVRLQISEPRDNHTLSHSTIKLKSLKVIREAEAAENGLISFSVTFSLSSNRKKVCMYINNCLCYAYHLTEKRATWGDHFIWSAGTAVKKKRPFEERRKSCSGCTHSCPVTHHTQTKLMIRKLVTLQSVVIISLLTLTRQKLLLKVFCYFQERFERTK